MSNALSIRNGFYGRLLSLDDFKQVTVGNEVITGDFPMVKVKTGTDELINRHTQFIDWQLEIETIIYNQSYDSDLEGQMLTLRSVVYNAIMGESMGIHGVMDIQPTSAPEIEESNEGDEYTAALPLRWLVRYRTPVNSI